MSKEQIAAAAAKHAPPIGPAWKVEPCCKKHDVWFVVSQRPSRDLEGSHVPTGTVDSVHASPAEARWTANRLNDFHKAWVQKMRQH
jgi:hypothetical protein